MQANNLRFVLVILLQVSFKSNTAVNELAGATPTLAASLIHAGCSIKLQLHPPSPVQISSILCFSNFH